MLSTMYNANNKKSAHLKIDSIFLWEVNLLFLDDTINNPQYEMLHEML